MGIYIRQTPLVSNGIIGLTPSLFVRRIRNLISWFIVTKQLFDVQDLMYANQANPNGSVT